jgi:hypothetical protein
MLSVLLDGQRALHAGLLVARLAAEVRVGTGSIDTERARRFLAGLGADFDGLRDAVGDVEVVDDLAAGVVQRYLDRLTGFGGERRGVELHGVHRLDGQLLRPSGGRRATSRRVGARRSARGKERQQQDEKQETCVFHELPSHVDHSPTRTGAASGKGGMLCQESPHFWGWLQLLDQRDPVAHGEDGDAHARVVRQRGMKVRIASVEAPVADGLTTPGFDSVLSANTSALRRMRGSSS